MNQLLASPRRLFLLDGIGALYSALMLGVVLPHFQPYFGIPPEVLRLLAIPPLGFALFDAVSHFVPPARQPLHLRIIAGLNGSYCALSFGLALLHRTQLTPLGWGYVSLEIVIVLLLARVEWQAAQKSPEPMKQPRRILILLGHPDPESFNAALADAYVTGARESGAEVQRLNLGELDFDLNLRHGYRRRTELEPDLLEAQRLLRWADHWVWIYPVWWGSVPAVMKGFLDRVLLPGFAFQKRPGSVWWDKFFTGKTARLIFTMDQPPWYYRLRYGRPSTQSMRLVTLKFIGVGRVRTTAIGPLRLSTAEFRERWLRRVEKLGNAGR